MFFYQQGLANDTYGLEEFRKYQMANWKPLSKKQQNGTDLVGMSPLENIRVGFVRLNLASDDVSGNDRLELCGNYEVAEQDFNRLISFYFNYVNMGDFHYRKVRVQRMLRLMHRIFAININMTIRQQSLAQRDLIDATAKSLFEQLFGTVNINGVSNPYFNYFYSIPGAPQSNYIDVNNDLVLMFLAFLGPHFLYKDELYTCFCMLGDIYTGQCFDQAFDSTLLSDNINEYNSPQSLANQLNAAGLDAGTALLIGLTAMASAAFQRMDSGLESQETLETVFIRCLPYELLPNVYRNIASHCRSGRSCPVPGAMYTLVGMQAFTLNIVGIDPTPSLLEPSSPENLDFLVDYFEYSGSEESVEELDSEDQDQSVVVQQQNELITQLRQELASHPATEEAGAVGGATRETKKCPICFKPVEDIMLLQNCGHAGFCECCAERIINEQRVCPFCRKTPFSYVKVIDKSFY
ncbi:RING finger protein [Endozoicomonas sp. ISHI1]|uniref:RING finger protein n=1 Tax=Endozoicomonas sp. ISHI1 TaxID=2825882 RepID=UPI002147D425|nr:RING finger protein [Endozoicomonas sp. ISHI1]